MPSPITAIELPGLNCGACGAKTCDEFAVTLQTRPELLKRCIHLSDATATPNAGPALAAKAPPAAAVETTPDAAHSCAACGSCAPKKSRQKWVDSLGREFDFVLDLFPNEPGPRETIKLHNPMLTREMNIQVGDTLIGRPLGMSCGCPITHCGVATQVDPRTGVIVWCVTGPLNPRQKGFKDLGYYSAEAYEGLITETRAELKVGMRYWFMPHKCMLQWRHSGLINFLNKVPKSGVYQVRLEGLLIG
ncbi:MAG: Fe-S cluster protein [bacterium]|nr:Fe-S cluster protein [bacterium]